MTHRRFLTALRHWHLRVAAVLVLVLQVGVVIEPLADHDGRVPAGHMEHRGHRHPRAHNERTCIVCGVRALQTPTPAVATPPIMRSRRARVETAYVNVAPARDPPAANSSRAPPPLS